MIKRALFIGLSTFDIIYDVPEFPKFDEKIFSLRVHQFGGGPAFNAAITYSILGGEAYLLTRLDGSPLASASQSEAKSYGVKIISCPTIANFTFPIASVIIDPGRSSRAVISGAKQRVADEFGPKDIVSALEFAKPSFILVDGHYLGTSAVDAIPMSLPIVLDAGSWKAVFETLFRRHAIVVAGESFKPPRYGAEEFCRKRNIERFAVTRGDNAILGYSPEGGISITPPTVTAIDTLAAGDIFHGAFSFYYHHSNLTFEESLKKASIVASKSCEYYGPRRGVILEAARTSA